LREELQLREQLQQQLKELEDAVMLQKDGPSPQQQQQQQHIQQQLEKLPVVYDDAATLDQWTLQVAGVVIQAAKIEDNDEVLRQQTTLAFKTQVHILPTLLRYCTRQTQLRFFAFAMQTTLDRWNQVKMLTNDQQWEDVKKELVVYLLLVCITDAVVADCECANSNLLFL
jgi:hypothetical protein